MDKIASKLIFKKYIVQKVEFEANEEYTGEEVKVKLDINKSIEYIGKNMNVTLIVKLFDNIGKEAPFKMLVQVKGIFELENNIEKIDYEPNAIAILYPYIRAIVSTYTATANVTPLILPAINVNKLLDNNKE